MKRLKRMACLFLTAALMLMCLPLPGGAAATSTVASGTCGTNATWVLDSNGTLTISGTGAMSDFDNGAPWEDNDSQIKQVIIEDGITTVGARAFMSCSALTSAEMANSVTEIGNFAFSGCENLSNVTLSKSLTKIGLEVFECTAITEIELANSLTSIGEMAFYHCDLLESIIIPDSVTYLGQQAFAYCSKLKTLKIGSGITAIESFTFKNCTALTSVSIPDSVTGIYDGAFNGCSNLSTLDLGNGVKQIGYWVFYGCNINSVTIPASLTDIDDKATLPVNVAYYVAEDHPSYTTDANGVLYNKDKTALIAVPHKFSGVFTCPDTVKEIWGSAFADCQNLTSVMIPDTVTRISNGAFSGCSALTSVVLPEELTNLNSYVFENCSSLTDLVIKRNVKKIYGHVFDGCSNLKNIYILGRTTEISTQSNLDASSPTIYGYTGSTAESFAKGPELPFIPLDEDLVIIPALSNPSYTIGSNGVCTVYCGGEITDFQGVKMDGILVDTSNYTAEAGSTIVTFKAAYLETLSEGEHTVTLIYSNGSADTTITVAENTCEHSYDNACDTSCNLCGAIRTVTHSWGAISSNDTQHWYECTVCHEKKDLANHEGGTATCKEKATCTACGKQYGSYTPCSYTAEVAAIQYLKAAATCNTKAIYYKSCPECGSTGTDTFTAGEFDKTNHTGGTEIRNVATATCNTPGYTGDTYCLGCDTKIATGTATDATGQHSGGTATCKEKAVCTTCGTAYGDLADCEHTEEVAEAKYLKTAATCKDKAVYYKSCKVCGSAGTATFTAGEVDKTNHTGGTEIRDAVAATCSKPGYTGDTYCIGCNTKTETGTAIAENDNHTGGTATCKDKAVCVECGQSYGELAQHSYNDYKANNDATCEADGTKTAECVYGCGTTDTVADTGSAKGHAFKTYTSDNNATCQADGTKTAKCENCDKTDTVADKDSKVDHHYGDDNFCDFCGKDKGNPQTGDTTNLVLLTSIMVISLLMAVALVAGMYKAKKVR